MNSSSKHILSNLGKMDVLSSFFNCAFNYIAVILRINNFFLSDCFEEENKFNGFHLLRLKIVLLSKRKRDKYAQWLIWASLFIKFFSSSYDWLRLRELIFTRTSFLHQFLRVRLFEKEPRKLGPLNVICIILKQINLWISRYSRYSSNWSV